ncbi:hypothetical protein BH23GEM3_BH23GEM3_04780 [soil metagenome]
MAIEGPLRELALSDVLQLLELSRKTGTLSVRSDTRDRAAAVRFERGAIVGAELPDEGGRLGHLLLRSGKISALDMQRVLQEQRDHPDLPFGTLAVRLGIVSVVDVRRQLAFQIEETVFELMRWKDGYFRFEETPPQLDGVVPVRIPTQSLLMEAARRLDEWATLSARIPHPNVVPRLEAPDSSAGTTLDLQPHEWEILAEIDGERTLKQIAAELGRSDFEVAKTVFGLLATHIVALADAAPVAPITVRPQSSFGRSLGEVEQALREGRSGNAQRMVDSLLREHPDSAEVHAMAGRTFRALGRWFEATEALAQAVRLDPLAAASHFQLGFAAARTGDLRRAEYAWTTYLRLPEARGPGGQTARRALEAAATLRTILEEEGP